MDYIVAFDIGTTSTRCILIDRLGKLIKSAKKGHSIDTPRADWAEQDPEQWWKASVHTIKEVLDKSKIDPRDISAIGLSGQMHSSIFLDKEGKVIRPAILWCDQRTSSQC